MTNKLKEAIKLVEKSYSKLSLMLETDSAFHTITSLVMANLSEVSLLLQEANDGKEVSDKRGEPISGYQSYNCPNSDCDMNVTQSLEDEKFTENYCPYCGKKLKWPEQQEEPKEEFLCCSAKKEIK